MFLHVFLLYTSKITGFAGYFVALSLVTILPVQPNIFKFPFFYVNRKIYNFEDFLLKLVDS